MKAKIDEINLLIAGEKTIIFEEAIKKLEKDLNESIPIKIMYLKNICFERYVNLIDNDGNYFNIIAVNYKTQKDILKFFEDFNYNYKETCLTTSSYPFFLIDKNIFKKSDLYKEIIKINNKKPDLYKFRSKDIIEYNNETLPEKILGIYKYYYQIQEKKKQERTLNIMVCGKKRTGKTFFINELLFENRGLSKENNYTTKMTTYEHKLFPIMIYDFPGFSDNEDKGMIDATNYISKFSEEYQNMKNKIHLIFYMLQNDSGRTLQDKEVCLIENFLQTNIPIFFITNRVEKNNYKTFKRNFEERIKLVKSKFSLEELNSRLFIIDSTNKSIKSLLNAVIKELQISKLSNENIIKLLSQNVILNDSNNINGDDKKESFINEYEIIENNFDEEKEELRRNQILEYMKKSIFFNDYSKTFKNVERKINEIIDKIQEESNTHLIPLLTAKNDLIKLFNELKIEFKHFISEEKMKKNFPALSDLSEIDVDDNSIGLIIDAIICFLSVLAIGSTGTFTLAFGLPIYYFTGQNKKKKIENILKNNANMMFKKFKESSIEDSSIKRTAEEYNIIIDKFIKYSKYFDKEHENDIDLLI